LSLLSQGVGGYVLIIIRVRATTHTRLLKSSHGASPGIPVRTSTAATIATQTAPQRPPSPRNPGGPGRTLRTGVAQGFSRKGAVMPGEFRVVSTFKSGWKRQGEWIGPVAARQIFEVIVGLPSSDVVAVDLEKRKGLETRTVLRYERVGEDGRWSRLNSDQLVRLNLGGREKTPVARSSRSGECSGE
jgi:hypothetical protein